MNKFIKPIFIIALSLSLALSGCSGAKTDTSASIEIPKASSNEATDSPDISAEKTADSSSAPATEETIEVPTGPNTMGEPETSQSPIRPGIGILTAGEWDDNKDFAFLLDLMQKNSDYRYYTQEWSINVSRRIVAKVTDGNRPIANAEVNLITDSNEVVWTSKTNNQGIAYLFNGIGKKPAGSLMSIRATVNGEEQQLDIENPGVVQEFIFQNQPLPAKSLDISLVIDTTGSMGDELKYLTNELEGVVSQVSKDNANIPIRTSVSVYRDDGDSYVVKHNYLNDNINDTLKFISKQKASGGGDFEEAVEQALDSAINDQTWNKSATARIILLVLDAPPHNTPEIQEKMKDLMEDAAEQGIVIIPVASSGIDKTTEFLLRSLSVTSGGTYVFLTDDSGVGASHIEPTIGYYQVEYLNELLVRVINSYAQ